MITSLQKLNGKMQLIINLLNIHGDKMLFRNTGHIKMFILFAAVILGGCSKKQENNSSIDRTVYTDTISVEAAKATMSDIKVSKTFSANLEGQDQANLYSKIPERITEIKVKVGDYVRKGQLVIGIDKSGASSQFFQAQAAFLNSQRELDRMKSLYEAGAVSKQMLDGIQTQHDVSKANFDAARSTVEIVSPLNGYVTALNVNIGDLANPGTVLATIADIKQMKALFNVGEADAEGFFVGQTAEVYSELKPDLIKTGKIYQISKSAQISSRTFEMRAMFPNSSDNWFKPGMFCKVNVQLKTQKGSLTIPNQAIMTTNNSTGVFVVIDNKSTYKNIKTGVTDGKVTEVLSGLQNNDMVVTLGMNQLKDGTVVRLNNKQ